MTSAAESIENSVGHDLNGNMASFTDGCGTTTYAWDSNSRLVSISGYSPDCSALAASYTYDALGRRIAKTINGETTKYLYDGADIVLEMNELNVATAYYIHGPGVDEPLARIELNADGTVRSIRFYIADALGSIIALTDENGTIKTQYNYTPFGEPETIGEESDNPFMFAAREYDPETGLLHERHRDYSPALGRYISEDPIGFAGGDVNFYARVGNNPVNFVDPWGLVGFGGVVSESTELGLFFPAIGQTGTAGKGIFWGGEEGASLGYFGSWGGFAGGTGTGICYPNDDKAENAVAGAYAGVGVGGFITNANSAKDLRGISKVYFLNLGAGPKLSFQLGVGDNAWIFSVTYGYGLGASGGAYNTNTGGITVINFSDVADKITSSISKIWK